MEKFNYCYPDSDVLVNKLNIRDKNYLSLAETELTFTRLMQLQSNPIEGNFDFNHLKKIHKFIFQDLYDWAGKERTCEIGKGNLFCLTEYIQSYANTVFKKYFPQCYSNKNSIEDFINVFSNNYADLNALHPFREGNGRTQREFARCVCLKCGYDFDLSVTTHEKMLEASILSFNEGNNSKFIKIFSDVINPLDRFEALKNEPDYLKILTADDLNLIDPSDYDYYETIDSDKYKEFSNRYSEKITSMKSEYDHSLSGGRHGR